MTILFNILMKKVILCNKLSADLDQYVYKITMGLTEYYITTKRAILMTKHNVFRTLI